jgi:hypothetical protein
VEEEEEEVVVVGNGWDWIDDEWGPAVGEEACRRRIRGKDAMGEWARIGMAFWLRLVIAPWLWLWWWWWCCC